MASGAANRYAQAVFSLARSAGRLTAGKPISRSSTKSWPILARNGLFEKSKCPDRTDKQALLDNVLANAQPEARNLAQMLIQRQRINIVLT